ncbi:unnamed protein product [Cladocopium goreaui]|uniref:Uncharacterized protein n=1 Tax=Cladocopium goreaui TaxID=2562237 RepID=A0A9P1GEP7_9DINO|nr:unnamed protein product [Cladocopium goreaui]
MSPFSSETSADVSSRGELEGEFQEEAKLAVEAKAKEFSSLLPGFPSKAQGSRGFWGPLIYRWYQHNWEMPSLHREASDQFLLEFLGATILNGPICRSSG